MFKDRLRYFLCDRHPKTLFRMFLYSCETALPQIEKFQENGVKKQMVSSKKWHALYICLQAQTESFWSSANWIFWIEFHLHWRCARVYSRSSFWIAVAFLTAHSLQTTHRPWGSSCFTQWQIWGYSQQKMTIVPEVMWFLAIYYQQSIHLPPIELWEVLVQTWREGEKGGEGRREGEEERWKEEKGKERGDRARRRGKERGEETWKRMY